MTDTKKQEGQVDGGFFSRPCVVMPGPNKENETGTNLSPSVEQTEIDQHNCEIGSVIEETQYTAMELDSQASPDPEIPATEDLQKSPTRLTLFQSAAADNCFSSFVRADVADEPGAGFRFGKAIKLLPGSYSRPVSKPPGIDIILMTGTSPGTAANTAVQYQEITKPNPAIQRETPSNSLPSYLPECDKGQTNSPQSLQCTQPEILQAHKQLVSSDLSPMNITADNMSTQGQTQVPDSGLDLIHQSHNFSTATLDPVGVGTLVHNEGRTYSTGPLTNNASAVPREALQPLSSNSFYDRSKPRYLNRDRMRTPKKPIGANSTLSNVSQIGNMIFSGNFQNSLEQVNILGTKLKERPFPEVHTSPHPQQSGRAAVQSYGTGTELTSATTNENFGGSKIGEGNDTMQQQHLTAEIDLPSNDVYHTDHPSLSRGAVSAIVDGGDTDQSGQNPIATISEARCNNDNLQELLFRAGKTRDQLDPEHNKTASNAGQLTKQKRGSLIDTSINSVGSPTGSTLPPINQYQHPVTHPQIQQNTHIADISRPVRPEALRDDIKSGSCESMLSCRTSASKVKKANNKCRSARISTDSDVSNILLGSESFKKVKAFLSLGSDLEKTMEKYEEQKEALVSQEARIQGFQQQSSRSQERIAALEVENHTLLEKLGKFAELSSKYKHHVNDVVKMQKYLKSQAVEMRGTMKEAIGEAIDIRNGVQEAENSINSVAHTILKGRQTLRAALLDLRSTSSLEEQIKAYQEQVKSLTQSNKEHERTIQKHLLELSSESHKSSGLEQRLEMTKTLKQEFEGSLEQISSDVALGLVKVEDSVMRILNYENSTENKLVDIFTQLTELKTDTVEPVTALAELIANLFTQFEHNLNAKDDSRVLTSNVELLRDLKEHMNQRYEDHENLDVLKAQAAELRESNVALNAHKNLQELRLQGSSELVGELRQELTKVREQYVEMSREVIALEACATTRAQLEAEVLSLESRNTLLQDSLDNVKKDFTNLNGEIEALKQSTLEQDGRITYLQQKLVDAQTEITNFEERKRRCEEELELKAESFRQELAKSANASKATLTSKFQSQIKNLEQKRTEAEKNLSKTKQEAQALQDELVRCKEYVNQQESRLERFEEEACAQKRHTTDLRSARDEMSSLQNNISSLQGTVQEQWESSNQMKALISGLQLTNDWQKDLEISKTEISGLRDEITALHQVQTLQNVGDSYTVGGSTIPSNLSSQHDQRLMKHGSSISVNLHREGESTCPLISATPEGTSDWSSSTTLAHDADHTVEQLVGPQEIGPGKYFNAVPRFDWSSETLSGTISQTVQPRRLANRKPSKLARSSSVEDWTSTFHGEEGYPTESTDRAPGLKRGVDTINNVLTFAIPNLKPFSQMPMVNSASSSSLSDLDDLFGSEHSALEEPRQDTPSHRDRQERVGNVSARTSAPSVSQNVDAEMAKNRTRTRNELSSVPGENLAISEADGKKARAYQLSTVDNPSQGKQDTIMAQNASRKINTRTSNVAKACLQPPHGILKYPIPPALVVYNETTKLNESDRYRSESHQKTRAHTLHIGIGLSSHSISGESDLSKGSKRVLLSAFPTRKIGGHLSPELPIRQPARNPSKLKRAADRIPEPRKRPRTQLAAKGHLSTRRIIPDS